VVATFERTTIQVALEGLRSAFASATGSAQSGLAPAADANRPLPSQAEALGHAQGVLGGSILSVIPFRDAASGRSCIAVMRRDSDRDPGLRIAVLAAVGNTYLKDWTSEPFFAIAPQVEVVDLDGDGTPELIVLSHDHGTGAGTTTLSVYFPGRKASFRVEEDFDWTRAAGPPAPAVRFDPEPDETVREVLVRAALESGMLTAVVVDLDQPEHAVARWHKENGAVSSGRIRIHRYKGRPKPRGSCDQVETTDTVWYAFFKGPVMAYVPTSDEHYVVFSAENVYDWTDTMAFGANKLWFAVRMEDAIMSFEPAKQRLERFTHIGPRKLPPVENLAFMEGKGLLVINGSTYAMPADLRSDRGNPPA
jgi:hypothetical protein